MENSKVALATTAVNCPYCLMSVGLKILITNMEPLPFIKKCLNPSTGKGCLKHFVVSHTVDVTARAHGITE